MQTRTTGYEVYGPESTFEPFTQSIAYAYRVGKRAILRGATSFKIGRCTEVAFVDANGEPDELQSGKILFEYEDH